MSLCLSSVSINQTEERVRGGEVLVEYLQFTGGLSQAEGHDEASGKQGNRIQDHLASPWESNG